MMLKEDGGIKALLEMARSGSSDVIAQVARGMANFAKCESRGTIQGWYKSSLFTNGSNVVCCMCFECLKSLTYAGHRKGHSLLLEDGALTWLISNSSTTSSSTKRHIELALCHLAQNGNPPTSRA